VVERKGSHGRVAPLPGPALRRRVTTVLRSPVDAIRKRAKTRCTRRAWSVRHSSAERDAEWVALGVLGVSGVLPLPAVRSVYTSCKLHTNRAKSPAEFKQVGKRMHAMNATKEGRWDTCKYIAVIVGAFRACEPESVDGRD
jgi:hypothetical protein